MHLDTGGNDPPVSRPMEDQMESMKLADFLHSLPDQEVMEPVDLAVLLNRLHRELGYPDAVYQDVRHERTRRFRLRRQENQFGRDLVALEAALGLEPRTLTVPYWGIRDQHPQSKSFPVLAERTGVPFERLTEGYCKIHGPDPKPGRPKGSRQNTPQQRAPRPAPERVRVKANQEPHEKSPPAPSEAVLAVRKMFLDGHSPTEIYNRQFEQLLPGTSYPIKQGNITYYCTNLRQAAVGWPVLGVVVEMFRGKTGVPRAAEVLRRRYQAIKARFSETGQASDSI
jgi:hypothetical protein